MNAVLLGSGLVATALILGGLWRVAVQRLRARARADWGRPWLNALDGLNRLFCRRFHRLRRAYLPLPRHGPALVVANHPSGLDPLLMIAMARRPLRFLIAREQYERFGLQWLFRAVGCIPVDRATGPHRALAAARHALQRGEVVALFPQGHIHLDQAPPARLKRGILHLAERSGAPVYPMRIEGVRGAGHTLSAVFRRSRVRIQVSPHLYYDESHPEQLLERLGEQMRRSRT